MKKLLIAILMLLPLSAHGNELCMIVADYAVTSRAMVIAGVEPAKIDHVLSQMYKGDNDEAIRNMDRILSLAKESDKDAETFAVGLGMKCLAAGGDLNRLLGEGI